VVPRRLLALGVAAAALAGPAGAAAATDWTSLRTMNIAHQGGENEVPSNTMYAYERALVLGSDMLEVDIHTTSDREIVVLHDATVDRTTNGTGRVYDKTLEEVQALDAGHNLVPGEGTEAGREQSQYPFRGVRTGERRPPPGFDPNDFRIPSLREVLAAYPDVPINIEIKGASDGDPGSYIRNAEILAELLNGDGRTDGIIVASFHDEALARFHELAPQIDLAPGIAGVAGYKATGAPPPYGMAVFQVPIEFSGVPVTDQAFVQQAHADGYGVHVWTVNDPDEMNMLLDWGVDGIMTAEPMRLERVLCERAVARPPVPDGSSIRHCSRKGSIACDVEVASAERRRKGLVLTLGRADQFAGRCAGKVSVRGGGRRSAARFDFGEEPPGEGEPATDRARLRLRGALRRQLVDGEQARVRVRPYTAFAERQAVEIG
jgi:glycerophosphoryl diester phosphodiesterase